MVCSYILFSSLASLLAAELPELAKLKIAAEGGDAYARFQLAGQFDNKMDPTQAEVWLRKSAGGNEKSGSELVDEVRCR